VQKRYALLTSIVAQVWGGSFIAIKIGVENIPPISLAFLRFAIASPFMLILSMIWKRSRINIKELPMLIAIALTGVTLLYILQFTGVKYTSATNASLLINTNVLFIAIFSWIFLKEPFSYRKLAGVLLGFAGAVLVILNGSLSLSLSSIGDILIIFSAICWAIYSILGKKMLKNYDAFSLTTYAFIIGTILFIPFIYKDIWRLEISFTEWLIILYLSLICSVFAYVAWYYVLEKANATEVAIFLNLIPVFVMIMAHFILGEKITPYTLIGAVFIIYAIYLAISNK